MAKYLKYKPEPLPEGYRTERVKCPKCYGITQYQGVYGFTACEECIRGYGYLLIKTRTKKSKVMKNLFQSSSTGTSEDLQKPQMKKEYILALELEAPNGIKTIIPTTTSHFKTLEEAEAYLPRLLDSDPQNVFFILPRYSKA